MEAWTMEYSIPGKMRALVLTQPGKFEIQDTDTPIELDDEEVLCKIGAVAICGSDPKIIRGDNAGTWPPKYPFIPGHEWSGMIVKTGKGAEKFRVGDRVAGEAHKGCGHCRNCLKGRYTICLNYGLPEKGHRHYGFTIQGAYAQYAKFHIRSITPLADTISYAEAAMCDTSGVALHGIELSGITPGGIVAIIGPGPVGIMTMKIARAMGAGRIIMIGRGSRLISSKKLGADETVDITAEDPVDAVRKLTGGIGADECFECSGSKGTMNQAVRMVCKGGKVILLGMAGDDVTEELPFKYLTINEIEIHGSRANSNVSWKVLSMIANKNINVKDIITHTFPLEKFSDALDTFVNRKGNAVKVVIYPNGENM